MRGAPRRRGPAVLIFIGIALLIAVGLALVVGSGAGSLLGLTQDQTAQALPLVLIGIIVAASVLVRRYRFSELVSGALMWVGIFGVAMIAYAYRDDLQVVAGRVLGELAPSVAVVDSSGGTATFRRGRGGHFEVGTAVNGAGIDMIFDTGASAVVLTNEDAGRAGIDTSNLTYDVRVSTANGTGRAARVTLASLDIGGIKRSRVRAFIAEPGALEQSLLGLTFLETLESYSVTGNTLQLTD